MNDVQLTSAISNWVAQSFDGEVTIKQVDSIVDHDYDLQRLSPDMDTGISGYITTNHRERIVPLSKPHYAVFAGSTMINSPQPTLQLLAKSVGMTI